MGRNVFAYAALGVLTAPLWIPVTFAAYLGYKTTRYAFQNPKIAAAGLALAGLTWYAGCQNTVTTVSKGAQKVVQTYRTHQASKLEQKLQQERVEKLIAQTKAREYEQAMHRQAQTPPVQQVAPPVQEVKSPPPPPVQRAVQVMTDPDFAFYFMKTGDTIDGVAAKVGNPGGTYLIEQDNGISDSRKVLAGQLLKIRKEMITRTNADVYEQIPILRSTVLPGNVSISQACEYKPECISNVFTVSRELGLNYSDEFPYKKGARVVYYR